MGMGGKGDQFDQGLAGSSLINFWQNRVSLPAIPGLASWLHETSSFFGLGSPITADHRGGVPLHCAMQASPSNNAHGSVRRDWTVSFAGNTLTVARISNSHPGCQLA